MINTRFGFYLTDFQIEMQSQADFSAFTLKSPITFKKINI